jgi:hypothetical protein
MRRSVRDFDRAESMYDYGIASLYAVEAFRPERPVEFTSLPAYEKSVNRTEMASGLTFRTPISRWEW